MKINSWVFCKLCEHVWTCPAWIQRGGKDAHGNMMTCYQHALHTLRCLLHHKDYLTQYLLKTFKRFRCRLKKSHIYGLWKPANGNSVGFLVDTSIRNNFYTTLWTCHVLILSPELWLSAAHLEANLLRLIPSLPTSWLTSNFSSLVSTILFLHWCPHRSADLNWDQVESTYT